MQISLCMGVEYLSTPSYVEYLRNEIPFATSDTIKSYSAGVEFFGGFEYELNKNIAARLDYSFFLRNNNYSFSYYIFEYTQITHKPNLMLFYNIKEPKYKVKIGAGGGYHFHSLDNNVSTSSPDTYTAGGFSFMGEIILAPVFSGKMDGYISVFYMGGSTSSLKNSNGTVLKSNATGKDVNLSGSGPGVRLGVSFNLN